jgi:uncharacterized membrane protein
MSVANKLFGIWVVNKTVSSATPLFIRMLASVAAITVCAIIAALIIVMLIVGGVWLTYWQLTAYGVDTQTSALIIGSLLLALLASVITAGKQHCYRLRYNSQKIFSFQPAIGGQISRVANAFMEGFDSSRPLK